MLTFEDALDLPSNSALSAYVSSRSKSARKALLRSACHVDFTPATRLEEVKSSLSTSVSPLPDLGDRCLSLTDERDPIALAEYERLGLSAIRNGEVALLIMAGGQATRLGASVPKSIFEINFGEKASCLLEILIRRCMALRTNTSPFPHLIILVSEATKKDTVDFLAARNYYGYDKGRIHFTQQGMYPCVASDGSILLSSPLQVASAPNGNAGFFAALLQDGILPNVLVADGVKYLHVIGVDNPLTLTCDPVMIGFAEQRHLSVVNRVVHRLPGEKAGLACARQVDIAWQAPLVSPQNLGVVGNVLPSLCPSVLEYSEIPADDESAFARSHANIANHLFSVAFLTKLMTLENTLGVSIVPYHLAWKKVPYFDIIAEAAVSPTDPNAWKFEHFVFDLFHFCDISKFGLIICNREREFAPIKNLAGVDSVGSARRMYSALYGDK